MSVSLGVAHHDVLVVGAGHGGAHAAIALRQQGFDGSIALLGAEDELPYDRPPLSKKYLLGERTFDKLLIRPAAFWETARVDMMRGARVVRVDPVARTVTTDAGAQHGYGSLIWATGGTPRRLTCPGHGLLGVHTIRTRADIDRLTADLDTTKRLVVIGGGYIGLEAASAISKRGGLDVTVLEAADRVLARVAGEPLSRFFEDEHRAHGVRVELGASVEQLVGSGGRVSGVRLTDGRTLPAEAVIVGIGITPEVEPLRAIDAAGPMGAVVDERCRTTVPDIFAIGDCAVQYHELARADIRLESVQNAVDQAAVVARAIIGSTDDEPAARPVPRFWSDQYDLKLQTIGLCQGHDQVVVRGELKARSFTLAYLRNGTLIALDCVNRPKDFAQGRALIARAARPELALLSDPDVALPDMCATAPATASLGDRLGLADIHQHI